MGAFAAVVRGVRGSTLLDPWAVLVGWAEQEVARTNAGVKLNLSLHDSALAGRGSKHGSGFTPEPKSPDAVEDWRGY